jgi:hypothetical protein
MKVNLPPRTRFRPFTTSSFVSSDVFFTLFINDREAADRCHGSLCIIRSEKTNLRMIGFQVNGVSAVVLIEVSARCASISTEQIQQAENSELLIEKGIPLVLN